jgi:hypothetical protein
MDKKLGVYLFAFLVVAVLVANIGNVTAELCIDEYTGEDDSSMCSGEYDACISGVCVNQLEVVAGNPSSASSGDFPTTLKNLLVNVFWGGNEKGDLSDKDMNALGVLTRWLMLFLVILLIYSGMSMAKFPDNSGLRFIIALIVGFLAVVMINNSEFITLLQSYKALGITVSILLPMMALSFITYTVAISLNSFGILLQRLAWLIYSIFLFLKVGGMLIFRIGVDFKTGWANSEWFNSTIMFLFGVDANTLRSSVLQMNGAILVILLIVAIATFMWFVLMNENTVRWIARATQVADLDRYRDRSERSSEKVKVDSDQTKK